MMPTSMDAFFRLRSEDACWRMLKVQEGEVVHQLGSRVGVSDYDVCVYLQTIQHDDDYKIGYYVEGTQLRNLVDVESLYNRQKD